MGTEKTLILVTGCHRSGTSAVAGCLAQMGVHFVDNLIPRDPFDNPRGFFEDDRIVGIHDHLLASVGASWDNPPPRGTEYPAQAWMDAQNAIREIIREMPGPICGVKDPRATLMVELWRGACEMEGVALRVLRVFRDWQPVIESLVRREGWDGERAANLVVEYSRGEWDSSIHFPYALTELTEWDRCFSELDIRLSPSKQQIETFFDPHLVHHGAEEPLYPPWTVICPSGVDENLHDMIGSLIATHPDILPDQIIVISNGLSKKTRKQFQDVIWQECRKPFIFARNVNDGVRLADPRSDIVIVGDDVCFVDDRTIDLLRARSWNCAAVAPSVTGYCGQPYQCTGAWEESADWLAFICVYIPRRVWDAVGGLDERFEGYGYEDADWCIRAADHGPLRIEHRCRVTHMREERSRWRRDDSWRRCYAANWVRFAEKWPEHRGIHEQA